MTNIEKIYKELEDLREQYEKLGKKIERKYSQWVKLKKKESEKFFGDIEWLINNPDSPGQYEALKAWLEDNVGGVYKGVYNSGYYPNINQQAFSFNLSYEDERNPEFDWNIRKFLDLSLKYMKPSSDNLIIFTIGVGQYSGIYYLAYDVEDESWCTFNRKYNRDSELEKWGSFEEALEKAWDITLKIED